ncbi:hypothetical protein PCANC_14410 [Puccinia coronata f. sp. avenae]|uniref:Tf2-1-like SH3-like domain-containing protein n=1 Tax=Puccinia coronata f. sp. avenae TaxID=200324 RepID=A0A2N5UZQ7_9BASI|nr:hypothetical protein PCANC_14410 [Puccinia coronata f. sp. avenae]
MLSAEQRASQCIEEPVAYNKECWDRSHKDHDIKVGDRVLVSMVNFQNLGGNKKLKDAFVGPFFVKALHRRNAVEVVLTEGFDMKHPTFPVSLLKKYHLGESDTQQPVTVTPPVPMEKEERGCPTKILEKKLTRVQGWDCRLYLTRFKNKLPDDNKWLPSSEILEADKLLRWFRASKRNPEARVRAILFCGGECQRSTSPARTAQRQRGPPPGHKGRFPLSIGLPLFPSLTFAAGPLSAPSSLQTRPHLDDSP